MAEEQGRGTGDHAAAVPLADGRAAGRAAEGAPSGGWAEHGLNGAKH